MEGDKIEIKRENVLAAYNAAKEAGADSTMKVLEALFGKDPFKPKNVTERIKTFEDACEWCLTNDKNHLVAAYQSMCGSGGTVGCEDVEAYLKLRIICAALNEGWEPQFTEDEWRYFPWFYIYTKKELEEMDEGERSRVVGRASYGAHAFGGLAFASAVNASSRSITSNGSRLAFKSEELAVYCGQQFFDIWADFIFGRK